MRKSNAYRTGKCEAVARKMAAMRAAKERKRLAGPAPEYRPRKPAAGTLLGVLEWRSVNGDVHRIPVRQGARRNQIRVPGCRRDHGLDLLCSRLREKLTASVAAVRRDLCNQKNTIRHIRLRGVA